MWLLKKIFCTQNFCTMWCKFDENQFRATNYLVLLVSMTKHSFAHNSVKSCPIFKNFFLFEPGRPGAPAGWKFESAVPSLGGQNSNFPPKLALLSDINCGLSQNQQKLGWPAATPGRVGLSLAPWGQVGLGHPSFCWFLSIQLMINRDNWGHFIQPTEVKFLDRLKTNYCESICQECFH